MSEWKPFFLSKEEGGVWEKAPGTLPEKGETVLAIVDFCPTLLIYAPGCFAGWTTFVPDKYEPGVVNYEAVVPFDEVVQWTRLHQIDGPQLRFVSGDPISSCINIHWKDVVATIIRDMDDDD